MAKKTDFMGVDFDDTQNVQPEDWTAFDSDEAKPVIDITSIEAFKSVQSVFNHPVDVDLPDGRVARFYVKSPSAGLMRKYMERIPSNKKVGKVTHVTNNVDMIFLVSRVVMKGPDSQSALMSAVDWRNFDVDFIYVQACFKKAMELAGMAEDDEVSEGKD